MGNEELSKEESLKLITEMIGQAKRNVARDGSFYFLMWGCVVMIANLSHYIIESFDLYEAPQIVWILTIPAAMISIARGSIKEKKAIVKSHYDRIYGVLWMSVLVMVIITLVFMAQIGYYHNPIILMFSGVGTVVSGSLLRFKPLWVGGIVIWIGALGCFFVPIQEHYLIGAIAVLLGYLIPGFMLKKVEKDRV